MTVKTEALTRQQKRLLAYAHPLRAAVFTILTTRSASPSQVTRELGLERKDLSTVDYHMKQLVKLDCALVVDERRKGSTTEKLYRATERALVETEEWERLQDENPALADHMLVEFMQVQLDDYTLALREETVGEDDRFHMTRTRRVLDAEGMDRGLEIYERCRLEMDEVERESAERRSDGAEPVHVSSCLGLFPVPAPPASEV